TGASESTQVNIETYVNAEQVGANFVRTLAQLRDQSCGGYCTYQSVTVNSANGFTTANDNIITVQLIDKASGAAVGNATIPGVKVNLDATAGSKTCTSAENNKDCAIKANNTFGYVCNSGSCTEATNDDFLSCNNGKQCPSETRCNNGTCMEYCLTN